MALSRHHSAPMTLFKKASSIQNGNGTHCQSPDNSTRKNDNDISTDALPAAQDTILERLVSALVTEDLLDLQACAAKGVQVQVASATVSRLHLMGPIVINDFVVKSPFDLLASLRTLDLLPSTSSWESLSSEISNSTQNLARARAAAADRARHLRTLGVFIPGAPFTSLSQTLTRAGYGPHALAGFEQWVIDGHPQSPSAKVKIGMSAGDAQRFAPEFGVTIGLRFVAVHKKHAVGENGRETTGIPCQFNPNVVGPQCSIDAMMEVLSDAFPHLLLSGREQLAARGLCMDDYVLIPTHPHQLEHALPHLHADALASDTMIPLNATVPAIPLMSLRSMVAKGVQTVHIKTALEVQLTGCIRGVSTTSVHNGPRMSRLLSRILQTDLDLALVHKDGGRVFNVAQELAGIAFRGSKRALGSLVRQDPESLLGPDEVAMPVAALLARNPLSTSNNTIMADILAECHASASVGTTLRQVAHEWIRAHASIAIPANLTLMARYGIALEPHPQNMVLILKCARPHSVYVRDFGGARVMPHRLARRGYSVHLEGDTGLVTDDPAVLRAKLYYPLFGNHLAEVVSSAAAAAGCEEPELWDIVRQVAKDTFDYLERTSTSCKEAADTRADADALLLHPWQRKKLVAMRLAGAVTDQMYIPSPNPLATLGERERPFSEPLPIKDRPHEERMLTHLQETRSPLLKRWLQHLPLARGDTAQDQFCAMAQENLDVCDTEAYGPEAQWEQVQSELADSACNLALARAAGELRGKALRLQAKVLGSHSLLETLKNRTLSDLHIDLDVLCVEGHRRHPCRRTRTGFSPADSIAYAPEFNPTVGLRLVAVHRLLVCSTEDATGRSVGGVLGLHYPHIIAAASEGLRRRRLNPLEYEVIPVHPWQADNAIPHYYEDEVSANQVVLLPEVQIASRPTVSTRTLLTVAPGVLGQHLTIKTAIDVQITSTVRTISPATISNGPQLTRLLARLFDTDALTHGRVAAVEELAGICFSPKDGAGSEKRSRGLSAVVRSDFTKYLCPNETGISGAALVAISPLTGKAVVQELVDHLAWASQTTPAQAALAWMAGYSHLLWSTTLPLLSRNGIALESHLQNTIIAVGPQQNPTRLLVRDLAGMRIHTGRFRSSGANTGVTLHHKSVILASELQVVYSKFTHAVVFGNLAEVVEALSDGSPKCRQNLWSCVRRQLLSVYESFVSATDLDSAKNAEDDLQVLMGPTVTRKALLTMRVVPAAGDCYVDCANPLHCELEL